MIIDVEKDDLKTDALKSRAHIKNANGSPISVINLHRMLINDVAKPNYYMDGLTEVAIRDQVIEVLKGGKRDRFHPNMYRELASLLNVPLSADGNLETSYEYCKKYFQVEYSIEGIDKALDMINTDTNDIKEIKIGEPNTDDLNQILAYGFIKKPPMLTTLAISPKAELPITPTSGFNAVKLGKFSTDLNNHPQTKHIKWQLLDLRYFGLHKII